MGGDGGRGLGETGSDNEEGNGKEHIVVQLRERKK
jgi:hypothetical protein